MQLAKIGAAALCALGLAACGSGPSYNDGGYYSASNSSNNGGTYAEYGRVVGIENVAGGDGRTSGAGAVLGGVIGGVLGHQVGSGRGNTAATIGGAVAGAAVGNEVERRREERAIAYRVDVRLDNGSVRSSTMDSIGDLRVGDKVRIDDGRVSRY
jgi:outer membrane lipoprotein SlyB